MTIREAMAKAEKEFDVILDRFYDRSKDVANAFEQSTAVFAARLQDMDAAGRGNCPRVLPRRQIS